MLIISNEAMLVIIFPPIIFPSRFPWEAAEKVVLAAEGNLRR